MDFETRSGQQIELRADDASSIVVEGYASVFNSPYSVGGAFTEVIAPGTFRNAIQRGDDVVFLINHNGLPLARSTAGNLTMKEDDHGLFIRAELDPTDPDVQRIVPKMRSRGNARAMLDEMSFAFRVSDGGDNWSEDFTKRTITDVMLKDVSIVNNGANPDTTIALRSLAALRSLTEARRTAKFSNVMGYLKRKATLQQRERHLD
jgi:HK97 family phage prohead protease